MSQTTTTHSCHKCGLCCEDTLPVTKREIERLKEFVQNHKIEDTLVDYSICPFYEPKQQRCNVYPIRPLICKLFDCQLPGHDLIELARPHMYEREPVSMRAAIFYGL